MIMTSLRLLKSITPSSRGELEITDINKVYQPEVIFTLSCLVAVLLGWIQALMIL